MNLSVYIGTKVYLEDKIEIILKNKQNTLQTNYETLLHTQKLLSTSIFEATTSRDRVIEIISEANTATKEHKKILREELHGLLQDNYQRFTKHGVLQYQFLFPNNESFYRAHKPKKFGDDLIDVRADFKYTNNTQKPIRGFSQGRVAHGFRNIFPLFNKNNKHIGAMEVSFSSNSFQWYFDNITQIHTHFLVNKKIFDVKTWQRDDLVLKYTQSAESQKYMIAPSTIDMGEDRINNMTKMFASIQEEVDSKIELGDAFNVYIKYNNDIEAVSFLPVKNITDQTVAWFISYSKSPIIEAVLFNALVIKVVFLFISLLIIYFLVKNIYVKKLIQTSLKYQRLLEFSAKKSSFAFWEYDFKNNTFVLNDLCYKFLGTSFIKEKSYKVSLEKYLKDFVPKESQQVVIDTISGAFKDSSDYTGQFEYTIKRRDGVILPVVVDYYTLFDKGGRPYRSYGTKHNIEVQKKKELELIDEKDKVKKLLVDARLSEKKIQNYLELMDKNIISSSTDLEGTITDVSTAFTELTGYSKDELIGQNHRKLKDSQAPIREYKKLWSTITDGKVWSGEVKNFKKDGSPYWINAKIFPIFNDRKAKVGYLAIRQDITDKKMLEKISIVDELTELYNRRHFNKVFQDEINRAKRAEKLLAFLMIDIDYFKQYNDIYGHQEGDYVIKNVAKVLSEFASRAGDNAFRLGGEEFGIIFTNTNREKVKKHVLGLLESVENLKILHKNNSASEYVTVSAGLAFSDEGSLDVDILYKKADDLLYKAKEGGRNKVSIN